MEKAFFTELSPIRWRVSPARQSAPLSKPERAIPGLMVRQTGWVLDAAAWSNGEVLIHWAEGHPEAWGRENGPTTDHILRRSVEGAFKV